MPRLTVAEELDVAIKGAARDADPKTPSVQVAETFYTDNRELVSSFADRWMIEKLAMLIGKDRAKARRENNPQLVIEGTLGIKRLPKKIEIKPGEKIARGQATIGAFRKLASELRQQEHPALPAANAAIALMSKYT